MCQNCINAIKKHWPDLPERDYYTLLVDATGWPLTPHEDVMRQVADMAKRSGCKLNVAIGLAGGDMDREARACESPVTQKGQTMTDKPMTLNEARNILTAEFSDHPVSVQADCRSWPGRCGPHRLETTFAAFVHNDSGFAATCPGAPSLEFALEDIRNQMNAADVEAIATPEPQEVTA